ncbi:MAG: hypothetical protein QNJ46_28365 [Leptolyngbyaceae cyanobacterium MO_188.B28]|nr:hypothetical protein [Leptolyngbyaceae cyanobacterium MO_188.B28]
MQTDSAAPFANNWAYLKTELNWLDRVLVMAVARQRQDAKDVDRLSQSRADRVTSHWWKGIITLSQQAAYDDCPPQKPSTGKKPGYQEQLENRIRASQTQGIILALPTLRDRLQLSLFEKNLILLTLAPEVNRRYGRLYNYLQKDEKGIHTDLPTVDLGLRLLCRNDLEWRQARAQLAESTTLIRHNIIQYVSPVESTLLSSRLKLSSWFVNYLLAEQPDPTTLATRLVSPMDPPSVSPGLICQQSSEDNEAKQKLPASLLAKLQRLCKQVTCPPPSKQSNRSLEVNQSNPSSPSNPSGTDEADGRALGRLVLLVGKSGAGKTLAASFIAQQLDQPCLWTVNLSLMEPSSSAGAISATIQETPSILLVKSAQVWFGRNPLLDQAQLNQWLRHRRQTPGITLLTVHHLQSIRPFWRHQFDAVVEFPDPKRATKKPRPN